MIYNEAEEYKIKMLEEVRDYIDQVSEKDRSKITKYIEYLRVNKGVLDEPYSKHIRDKIRELRVDFSKNHHRIFYFTFINKNIVLLHAFLKNTARAPESEIIRAERNLIKVLNSKESYED